MSSIPRSIQDIKKMKIQDAIQLLEDSAKDADSEFSSMVTGRYKTLRSALEKIFGHTTTEIYEGTKDRIQAVTKQARRVAEDSFKAVDENVRDHPWPYVGGGLVLGAALGFLLSRK